MPNRVVVGAQWGDEGKAKVVDFLTEEADLVIRFQGGANAGHTVEVGDQKFIFHLIPAGIMHPGKQCVIGNGVVLDPAQLLLEIEEVRSKGFDLDGRLWVAENAHVVLPYHKVLDQSKEKAAGKAAIGTTGRGIGPAYYDKVNRSGIRVADLLEEDGLREKLHRFVAGHNDVIVKMYGGQPLSEDAIFEEYRSLGRSMKPYVADTVALINSALKQGKRLIFEGAQGTVLDVDHGTYPFVTSSNTVAAAACIGSGVGPTAIDQVIGVSRPIPPASATAPSRLESPGKSARNCAGSGMNTAPPRAGSAAAAGFDAVLVRRAAMVNGLTHLPSPRRTSWTPSRKSRYARPMRWMAAVWTNSPRRSPAWKKVKPIYETLPGWKSPTVEVSSWKELPENARKYLLRVAELLEVPIGLISLGPKRHQTIQLDM